MSVIVSVQLNMFVMNRCRLSPGKVASQQARVDGLSSRLTLRHKIRMCNMVHWCRALPQKMFYEVMTQTLKFKRVSIIVFPHVC